MCHLYNKRIKIKDYGSYMAYCSLDDFISYLFTSYHAFDPSKGKISTWLHNCAKGYRSQCLRYIHQDSRKEKLFNTLTEWYEDNTVERNEQLDIVMNALNKIDERERQVVINFFFYNYSMKELKVIHKLSKGRLSQVLHNGIYQLRKVLGVNNKEPIKLSGIVLFECYTK